MELPHNGPASDLPPYSVCLLTPTSRATSSALRPASTCFSAAIICASVCLLRDIRLPRSLPSAECQNHTQIYANLGEQINPPATTREGFTGHIRVGLQCLPELLTTVTNYSALLRQIAGPVQ
jgi:hypothetical protein